MPRQTPMEDPAVKARAGFLQESLIRGTTAARNQIMSSNSGVENEPPTKLNRPAVMVPTRESNAETERNFPGVTAQLNDAAQRGMYPDGGVDTPRQQAEKRIIQDEIGAHYEDSPRVKRA
jgi:hypothetical protein